MAQNVIHNLVRNRDTIRKLMSMDANGQMDQIVENAVRGGNLVYGEEGATYTGGSSEYGRDESPVLVNENIMSKHPRMPRKILESFQNNPGRDASTSVLGGISFKPEEKQAPIRENVQKQPKAGSYSQPIDYSLLKTIINEAVQENVKKYMSALSKKLIKEGIGGDSGSSLKALKIGDTISLIAENGDIYEAKLTFKKNISNLKG